MSSDRSHADARRANGPDYPARPAWKDILPLTMRDRAAPSLGPTA
jgi:hypothetical protein